MALARTNSLINLRAVGALARRPTQSMRQYATEHSSEGKRGSNLPLFVGAASVAGVAVYYLNSSKHVPTHSQNQANESLQQELQSSAKGSVAQPDRDAEHKVSSGPRGGSLGQPPSTVDPADSRKDPGTSPTTSAKQEGFSNGPTDNPFMNEPGKSVKGEGEPETAKSKGAISPQRPQT
ncbi:hypothetical protein MW887_005748 [Aspergillus wentii]|nr:hypothetical protein MW887_005748 [Aspergillus wentii]